MVTKSFTSSVKTFNTNQSLEYITLCLQYEQTFYQIKIITMIKNYDESVEINHNPHWTYIPDHLMNFNYWWFRIRKNYCVIELN